MRDVVAVRVTRPNLAIVIGVALLAICAYLKTSHYPLYDNALFEYAGRAILRDQHLYAYVWDNKLPPIFYLNALYQQLFGERYALHLIAQIATNLGSIWLFARIAQRLALLTWGTATLIFAALLLLPPPQFNQVEYPALFLSLAAHLAWQHNRAILAGLLLAMATTFWVPAILLALPLVLDERPTSQRVGVVVCALLALCALGAVFIGGFGLVTMREVFESWLAYGSQAIAPGEIWSNLYHGALLSGAALAIAAAASLARRPQSPTERFTLVWAIAALAGAAATLRFYPHYFVVALAPLSLYVCAVGVPADRTRQIAAGAITFFFVWKSSLAIAGDTRHHWERATRVAGFARRINATLSPPRYIALNRYEPGIYLAADVPLRSRYELAFYPNERFLQGRDLNASLVRLKIDIDDRAGDF